MADGIEGWGFSLLEAHISKAISPSRCLLSGVDNGWHRVVGGYEARVFIARFLMPAKGIGVINEKKNAFHMDIGEKPRKPALALYIMTRGMSNKHQHVF